MWVKHNNKTVASNIRGLDALTQNFANPSATALISQLTNTQYGRFVIGGSGQIPVDNIMIWTISLMLSNLILTGEAIDFTTQAGIAVQEVDENVLDLAVIVNHFLAIAFNVTPHAIVNNIMIVGDNHLNLRDTYVSRNELLRHLRSFMIRNDQGLNAIALESRRGFTAAAGKYASVSKDFFNHILTTIVVNIIRLLTTLETTIGLVENYPAFYASLEKRKSEPNLLNFHINIDGTENNYDVLDYEMLEFREYEKINTAFKLMISDYQTSAVEMVKLKGFKSSVVASNETKSSLKIFEVHRGLDIYSSSRSTQAVIYSLNRERSKYKFWNVQNYNVQGSTTRQFVSMFPVNLTESAKKLASVFDMQFNILTPQKMLELLENDEKYVRTNREIPFILSDDDNYEFLRLIARDEALTEIVYADDEQQFLRIQELYQIPINKYDSRTYPGVTDSVDLYLTYRPATAATQSVFIGMPYFDGIFEGDDEFQRFDDLLVNLTRLPVIRSVNAEVQENGYEIIQNINQVRTFWSNNTRLMSLIASAANVFINNTYNEHHLLEFFITHHWHMNIDAYRILFRQEAIDFVIKVKEAFKIKINTDNRTEYTIDRLSDHYVPAIVRFYLNLIEILSGDTLFVRTYLFETPITDDAIDTITRDSFDMNTHAQLYRYLSDAIINISFFINK